MKKNIILGGKNIYGTDIGILMLESHFPRIVGDVGNSKTFDYPVAYKIVHGAYPKKIVMDLKTEDLKPFIEAGMELRDEYGVKAITTSCGFLSLFQNELASILNIPVFTSSLVQLLIICKMIGRKKTLIVTANSETLSVEYLKSACGDIIKDMNYCILGTQGKQITEYTVNNWDYVDIEECEKNIIDSIENFFKEYSIDDFGAILLECTNMTPYSDAIRSKFGLPVFNFVTLVDYVHSGFCNNYYIKEI